MWQALFCIAVSLKNRPEPDCPRYHQTCSYHPHRPPRHNWATASIEYENEHHRQRGEKEACPTSLSEWRGLLVHVELRSTAGCGRKVMSWAYRKQQNTINGHFQTCRKQQREINFPSGHMGDIWKIIALVTNFKNNSHWTRHANRKEQNAINENSPNIFTWRKSNGRRWVSKYRYSVMVHTQWSNGP